MKIFRIRVKLFCCYSLIGQGFLCSILRSKIYYMLKNSFFSRSFQYGILCSDWSIVMFLKTIAEQSVPIRNSKTEQIYGTYLDEPILIGLFLKWLFLFCGGKGRGTYNIIPIVRPSRILIG